MNNKETTTIRLEEATLNQVKKEAKLDNRTVSNYIETVLLKHLKEKELGE